MSNSKNVFFAVSLASLGLIGCASAGKAFFGHDIDVYGAVQSLRQKEANNVGMFGHLVPGASFEHEIENHPEAKPLGKETFELTWVSNKEGRICFETGTEVGSPEEQQRYYEHLRNDYAIVVRAYDSLDQVKPDDKWPTPAERTLDDVVRRGASARARFVAKNENLTSGSPMIEFCGAAPAVTPQTQYLIAYVLNLKHRENHFPLIWDYKGERSTRK